MTIGQQRVKMSKDAFQHGARKGNCIYPFCYNMQFSFIFLNSYQLQGKERGMKG